MALYVDSETATGAMDGSPLTIAVPAGIADGDMMAAAVVSTNSFIAPAGWTEIATALFVGIWVGVWKRQASSEPADYDWAIGADASGSAVGFIASFSSASPALENSGFGISHLGTVENGPAIVSPRSDDLLLHIGAAGDETGAGTITSSPPAGLTERVDTVSSGSSGGNFSNVHLSLATLALAAAGSTGPHLAILSAMRAGTFGILILVPNAFSSTMKMIV